MSTLLAHDSTHSSSGHGHAHEHGAHGHAPHAHDGDPHTRQTIFDKLGIGVSLTCAVHCVITALVSLLPTMGVSAFGPTMEWLELPLLFGALCVGLFALLPTYFREHRRPLPLVLFGIGISFITASRFVAGIGETALTVVGIGFVASAHVVNLRLHAAFHAK